MNILVVNYNDSDEDVMIFTERFSVEQVEKILTEKNQPFTEIYEVSDDDLQYYCYEPCWI